MKSVASSEAEKARLLRDGEVVKASALQHRIDGMLFALTELERHQGQLTQDDSLVAPAY